MEIIYEDEGVLVLNKPAGVVVNRAASVKTETVQDWLTRYLGLTGDEGYLMRTRSGLAHRLDKETSGCLLVGKNERVLTELLSQFKKREVEKVYVALVHGHLTIKEGGISLPIDRNPRDRAKRKVMLYGKKATTWWKVLSYHGEYTLVQLFPHTGRTHQIRVHMAHLGYPLFGDELYLTSKKREVDRLKLARHFLHAQEIVFTNPITKKRMKVEAPIPSDLKRLLIDLGKV